MQNEIIPSLSGGGGNKVVCTLWDACFSLSWHPYDSGLSSCFPSFFIILFILLYSYIHIWVTELIVPAHAFSADSIIRHSGHPEKKNEGGKRGMWAESVGEQKMKK